MIVFESIGHKYVRDINFVVKDISFSIKKGECVGLTGRSGCGKSTVGSIAAGYIKPTEGRIIVNGKNLTGSPSRDVFLIHQEIDLFPWQRVEKQILFALKQKDSRRVKELVELVKLQGFERYYPKELSGGMKKRLAIARALAINPKLLILDESFSSLDSNLKEGLYKDLKRIWEITKTTILLITHDSKDLENLAQKEVKLTGNKPTRILEIKKI